VPHICHITYDWDGVSNREPMNPEISTVFGIAICHGAKGIMPYAWESYYTSANDAPLYRDYTEFQMGMADFDNDQHYVDTHKRNINFYGEDKWTYVKELYRRMKNLLLMQSMSN
jgi:hypothetical protein